MYSITDPETFRSKVKSKILSLLQNDSDLSTNTEIAIYNYAIKEATNRKIIKKWENPKFVILYTDRLRTILYNLNSPDLLQQVLSKELTPQALVFMTHQEMKPERWTKLIDDKIKRVASKLTTNHQASTDMFTCKKCKGKRTTFYELQTRSADEPATIFITCLDCGQNMKR
uniref:TFIIS-type domain-containing protein n=1 Tax=viral metagenome TaxID=1070528 RepID=A0A6C0I4J2_9ZZZZ